MADTKKGARKRPPNPSCTTCAHPRSFHPVPLPSSGETRRKCGAFGCGCEDFVDGEASE